MTNIIEVKNLVKKYGNFTAVNNISFNLESGEFFGFLGPNGAGKTTTINILCVLLKATSGTAVINGFDVSKEPIKVRESIGLIFQDPSVDNQLTARENLQVHGELYNVPNQLIKKRIPEVLNTVELSDWTNRLVGTFSGGMKRRLEIARGLLHHPKVIFLDEPTQGLDPQTRNHIWQYIMKLRQDEGLTIFLTTHYMDEAENCGRIAIIDHGEIVAMDSPARLKAKTGEDIIFLDTDNNERAANLIESKFGIPVKRSQEGLQLEVPEGARFIPGFITSFSETEGHPQILSISLRRPTLEDVFIKITGRAIRQQSADAAEGQRIAFKLQR
ncbi:MAG: ATP-binding cassette domain-containing protein [Dehalococcoidia bacterium]|nr:ATP-binding cassette domain-containing protein [Dehalococcoidia bacterium]